MSGFIADPAGTPLTALFTPTPDTALVGYDWTRNHLLFTTLTDRHTSDDFLPTQDGFTQPTTLRLGRPGTGLETVREEPAFFDTTGIEVHQHFATSEDGTRVPYFVVGKVDTDGPTLLSGYGGFEIARLPHYDRILGRGWLARGGRYVVANIRGGGEYGPPWHHAAMRENRPRAYEDMAAVARDLVAR
jgi:prolyl oligopeptidase